MKVQRPEASAQVSVDCDIFLRVSSRAETRFPWARDIGVHRLAGGLVTSLLEELDYRTEAANTGAIASTMSNRPDIVVPHIYPNLSSGRVLVMERLHGTPLSDGESRSPASTATPAAASPTNFLRRCSTGSLSTACFTRTCTPATS